MASLIFAASYFTIKKIKTKREEKKNSKRKAYADRYSELEREHKEFAASQLHGQRRTGDSHREAELHNITTQQSEPLGRISSSESLRRPKEKPDGPSAWVDEVLSERSRGGTQISGRTS